MSTSSLLAITSQHHVEIMTSCVPNASLIAVIGHPHPQQGGNWHHKVVYTLHQLYTQLNISTIRFQFRGIGRSSGDYDYGIGECDDFYHVAQHAQTFGQVICSGFSFGAIMAAKAAMRLQNVHHVLTVAPPIAYGLPDVVLTCPWLIVQGLLDAIIDPIAVHDIAQQKGAQWLPFEGCGHFFHGQLTQLKTTLFHQLQPLCY
jgi:uncharacterized protein